MEYYSVLKNKLSSHEKTWKNLKCILLSERSQPERLPCSMIPTIWHSKKSKTMETQRSVVGQGWGGGERWIGRAQRTFSTVKILCDIMMDILCIPLYICQNWQKVQHQEWTLRELWTLSDYDVSVQIHPWLKKTKQTSPQIKVPFRWVMWCW